MPQILWTGKLSLPMTLLVNTNNVLAWALGNTHDTQAMTERVRQGYEGKFSADVSAYDDLGAEFQTKAGSELLSPLDMGGKEILEVGGGSGIVSLLALEWGASRVVCTDISELMLQLGRVKAAILGYTQDKCQFRQADAARLPYPDASFDLAISSMSFGLFPDQARAVAEMARVTRSGGLVVIAAHGPEHYWEACDASFRAISKVPILGYRLEFWPRKEPEMRGLFANAGLTGIETRRLTWKNTFQSGSQAYDFFAAITSAWWFSRFPPGRVAAESQKIRNYFERHQVTHITDDLILAYGRKQVG